MAQREVYEEVIGRYMQALANCDLDGLCALFSEDAQVYSPLLGWVDPRLFFEKMCRLSDLSAS